MPIYTQTSFHKIKPCVKVFMTAVKHGMPCIAEGSGFSYLHQTMSDDQEIPKQW